MTHFGTFCTLTMKVNSKSTPKSTPSKYYWKNLVHYCDTYKYVQITFTSIQNHEVFLLLFNLLHFSFELTKNLQLKIENKLLSI